MSMKKLVVAVVVFLASFSSLFSQGSDSNKEEPVLFSDFLMGPYLFIEHIEYDAVMLFGYRFGYEANDKLGFLVEYAVGQQEDEFNTTGLTHHASLQARYFIAPKESKLRTYAYAGGGFLEFKAFTHDNYGLGYYAGLGVETNIGKTLKGFVEPRYLRISKLGWNVYNNTFSGKTEIGVFWGIRLNF